MNATANPALGYPYFPYYPVVLDILRSRLADSVLDAPCDRGWRPDAWSRWTVSVRPRCRRRPTATGA